MRYELSGTTMQSLDVFLSAGETVYTESGGMSWMRGDIGMETSTRGGLMKGLMRMASGDSFFMTTYRCNSGEAHITFTPEAPGSVLTVELGQGETRICQKDAFMVAEESVSLEAHFRQKLGAGVFGGEGFILQKLTGPGTAWVEIDGEVREYILQGGETMKVDPGHIAMYEESVNFDLERVKGVKNMFFGGEGIFLATLTGPGRVWLQSMPISGLVARVAAKVKAPGTSGD